MRDRQLQRVKSNRLHEELEIRRKRVLIDLEVQDQMLHLVDRIQIPEVKIK
jgi:hypothetical protein